MQGKRADKFSLIILDEPAKILRSRKVRWFVKRMFAADANTIVALWPTAKCFDSANAKQWQVGSYGEERGLDTIFTLHILINSTCENEFQECQRMQHNYLQDDLTSDLTSIILVN